MAAAVDAEDAQDATPGEAEESVTAWVIDLTKSISGGAVGASSVLPSNENDQAFTELGALAPPLPPAALAALYSRSAVLRPNIEAMAANVDGFGFRLMPRLQEDTKRRREQVREAIFAEKVEELDGEKDDDITEGLLPSDEDVEKRIKRIELLALAERSRLTSFFAAAGGMESFESLRMRTRQDVEIFGYGFWEAVRDVEGRLALFNYVAALTVRLMPIDDEAIEIDMTRAISEFKNARVKLPRRFRRYVQIVGGHHRFFKDFGDPRVISRDTGKVYLDEAAMKKEEGAKVQPAREMIHFFIPSIRSPYGEPRWIGALPSVVGAREAEEVNLFYFSNKSVPPLAILVSGGVLAPGAIDRIKEHIEDNIKGKRNFHNVLVLEAESAGTKGKKDSSAGRVRIDIKPLTQAQLNDAQFLKYGERSADTVGMQWRMPRILRGDMRDFNRSTAQAALRFAEMQVFQPVRVAFDFLVQRLLASEFNVRFWQFISNAPVDRDPKVLAEIVRGLTTAGVLTPRDARRISADIFNETLPIIDEDWVKQPLQLTVAGLTDEEVEKASGIMAPILRLTDACDKLLPLIQTLASSAT